MALRDRSDNKGEVAVSRPALFYVRPYTHKPHTSTLRSLKTTHLCVLRILSN
ncbi:hypothetical protein APHCR_1491 [Anaplasma phagocytophilum str. CR1007]|nr:hypothetical protein APHCR_1491 [Anaplasma phagocytophilum str. CR1007]